MLAYEERGEKKRLWACIRKGMLEGIGNDTGLWVRNACREEEGRGTTGMGEATPHLQLPAEGVGGAGCRETQGGMGWPRSESNRRTCSCVVDSGNSPLLAGILPDGACGSSRTLPGEKSKSPLQGRSDRHNAGLLTRQKNLTPVLLASSRQVSCLGMGLPSPFG